MTKQINDDDFEYYVIEDKPKRKPKEDYEVETSAGQRRKLAIIGALVALLVGSATLYLVTPQRVFTNTISATAVSTSVPIPTLAVPQEVQSTPVPDSAVELAWSPDGKSLAVMTFDSLRIYQTDDLTAPLTMIQSYEGSVNSALYSPDGKTLAVASYQSPDNTADITLFDTAALQRRATLEGDSSLIQRLAFNPHSTLLAASGDDQRVHVWNVSTGVANVAQPELNYIDDLAFTRQGDLLVVGANDILLESTFQHVLEKWSLSAVEDKPFVLSTYENVIYHMQLSEDGSRMVVVTDTGLEVWDTADHFIIESEMDNLATETYSLAFSKDGKRVAIGRQQTPNSSVLQLWNVDERQMLRVASGDLGVIRTLALSPDGSQVAVGTSDGRLQLRDSTTGNLLAEIHL